MSKSIVEYTADKVGKVWSQADQLFIRLKVARMEEMIRGLQASNRLAEAVSANTAAVTLPLPPGGGKYPPAQNNRTERTPGGKNDALGVGLDDVIDWLREKGEKP